MASFRYLRSIFKYPEKAEDPSGSMRSSKNKTMNPSSPSTTTSKSGGANSAAAAAAAQQRQPIWQQRLFYLQQQASGNTETSTPPPAYQLKIVPVGIGETVKESSVPPTGRNTTRQPQTPHTPHTPHTITINTPLSTNTSNTTPSSSSPKAAPSASVSQKKHHQKPPCQTYTRQIQLTYPQFDVLNSPQYTSQLSLKLHTRKHNYILVFPRLSSGVSLMQKIRVEVRPFTDSIQVLDATGALLCHFRNEKRGFSMFANLGVTPLLGVYFLFSNSGGNGGNSAGCVKWIKGNEFCLMQREFKLQMVQFFDLRRWMDAKRKMAKKKAVVVVYGISTVLPAEIVINMFKSLGKLVSFQFAPSGKLTRFHVLYLQYSIHVDVAAVVKSINAMSGGITTEIRQSLLVNHKSQAPSKKVNSYKKNKLIANSAAYKT
ncbi:uncharacterized protein LODBEIA_P01180 [Lodderomyces beijingensis]|uniref:RRM domain-containing protein n=1 Tax=Lodderomyces beijingensis TaxID=1775926 RepID=A0ABP0ZCH6_9ASCO